MTMSLDNKYVPLQERYGYEGDRVSGWRVLVISMMLNRTSRNQVRAVIPEFFKEFPYALYAEIATYSPQVHEHLEAILTPLGFGHTRAQRIAQMSVEWYEHPDWRCVEGVYRFTGCSVYATDAWRIFVDRDYSVPSVDEVLETWRRINGGEVKDELPEVRSTGN